MDEQMGLELNEANLDSVLDEIRPYLVGARQHERRLVVINTKMGLFRLHNSPRCCCLLCRKVATVLLAQMLLKTIREGRF